MITRPDIRSLPKGLTIPEVARRLRTTYQPTRSALIRFKYRYADGRSHVTLGKVNWRLTNIALSRKHGMTRERWRVLRLQAGQPKVGKRGPAKKVVDNGNGQ